MKKAIIIIVILLSVLLLYIKEESSKNDSKLIESNLTIEPLMESINKTNKDIPAQLSVNKKKKFANYDFDKLVDLTTIEAKLIREDNVLDYKMVKEIEKTEVFLDMIEKYEQASIMDEGLISITEEYKNSFNEAMTNMDGEIQANEFQCGQFSCLGSFTSFDDSVWRLFLKKRLSQERDNPSLYAVSVFPVQAEGGATENRIFFTTNPEMNKISN